MNSVQTAVTIGGYRANVTAWDDGSIMVEVDGKPVTVDDVGVVAAAVRWSALDRVECRIVTEIPAQEAIDRAAAAVEQARLQAEGEAARVAAEAASVAVADAANSRRVSDSARSAVPVLATDPASIKWSADDWVVIGDGYGCAFCDRSRVSGLWVGSDQDGTSIYICSDCARNALAAL